MAVLIKRTVFDFLAKDFATPSRKVEILPDGFDRTKIKALPKHQDAFVQRWYLSVQGEDRPFFSRTACLPNGADEPRIYRYDWAFGITVIDPFWWDWIKAMSEDSAIAVHLLLEHLGEAPEAIPIAATLNALHPSRNTRSAWEGWWKQLPKAAADLVGETQLPFSKYASTGFILASNLVEPIEGKTKNWFLYQFYDEHLKCPTIEWRIDKQVLNEYGPLLRGSLLVAFYGSSQAGPGHLRFKLRPQVRYSPKPDLDFIVPTDADDLKERQVYIDVKPVDEADAITEAPRRAI